MNHQILLSVSLSRPLYPYGLALGAIVILLLIAREFLDTSSSARALRWERYARAISLPLTLLFVVSVAIRIAT
jgi:hypothetical protein